MNSTTAVACNPWGPSAPSLAPPPTLEAPPGWMPSTGVLAGVVAWPHCWRCGRTLAEFLTPPYSLKCPKCKVPNRVIPSAATTAVRATPPQRHPKDAAR